MPHYFTDLHLDDLLIFDQEGTDVVSLEEARDKAVEALRMAVTSKFGSQDQAHFSASIRDERGTTLYHATLSFNGHYGTPYRH